MRRTSTVSTLRERRNDFGSEALGLKRESDFVIEVAIPSHDLLFQSISVHDGFVVDAAVNEDCVLQTHLFEDRVLKGSGLRIGAGCSEGATSVVVYDSVM